ncbi:hypothetical protein K8I61_00265 [bacterium]|nr:hypothetical protein [bacterium]
MKLGIRFLVVAMTLAFAVPAMALDNPPKDSGIVIWVAPQVHLHDFQADIEFDDAAGTGDELLEEEMKINQTAGLAFNVTYVTPSPIFVTLEFAHHRYLPLVESRELEDFDGFVDPDSDDNQTQIRIEQTRGGLIVGAYLFKAPARPYIAVGGNFNLERLVAFGQKIDAQVPGASGILGVDYYVSEHVALGAAGRVDYLFGEEFSDEFEKGGTKHDLTVTVARLPLLASFRVGYMF